MFLNVNGIDLYYECCGSGRPLIMLHGNGEDHTIFDESFIKLNKFFQCFRIDSRGHGKSGKSKEYHYKDIALDVVSFIECLDLRNVILYGFSDGGIAGLIAACNNDRITSLIVSGANITPSGIKTFYRFNMRLDYYLHNDPRTRMMLYEPHIDDDTLKKIKANTLVTAGSNDLIKAKETIHIAQTIKRARLVILEGENHGSYVIHSEKIAKIICDFVNQ